MTGTVRYSVALRVQALTLLTLGGKSLREVEDLLKIPQRTLSRMKATALARGYNPDIDPVIKEEHVADGARPGRPKTVSADTEQNLIESMTMHRNGRRKTLDFLANELGISHTTACKILKKEAQLLRNQANVEAKFD